MEFQKINRIQLSLVASMSLWMPLLMLMGVSTPGSNAFGIIVTPHYDPYRVHTKQSNSLVVLHATKNKNKKNNKNDKIDDDCKFTRVAEEDEGVPIPFLDYDADQGEATNFIECYADSVATVQGVDYTIGVPCDYCVALCYFDENDNLVPVELNDQLMDDVFPIAENIVAEEFGEDLALQRTPQTLTLVGELEEDEDDEDDDEDTDEDNENEDDEEYNGEEEVEVLLSFEHRGTEFNLVRLLDPVLLVGKSIPERPDARILLSQEESDRIMPKLEEMFLKYHDGINSNIDDTDNDRQGATPGSSMLP